MISEPKSSVPSLVLALFVPRQISEYFRHIRKAATEVSAQPVKGPQKIAKFVTEEHVLSNQGAKIHVSRGICDPGGTQSSVEGWLDQTSRVLEGPSPLTAYSPC